MGTPALKVRVRAAPVMKAPAEPVSPLAALPLDQILRGDCVEAMRGLPNACVDMIFADPPYNL